MIESILTPPHPHPLKPLLNQPLASTLNHATAKGTLVLLKILIADVLTMGLEIGLHLEQCLQLFALRNICIDQGRQGFEYSMMLSMPE